MIEGFDQVAASLEQRPNGKAARTVELVSADEILAVNPDWVWTRRIPLGMLTMLAGREGLGKSTLMLHLAAEVTRGTLPGDLHGYPADVVVASAEDLPSAVIVPRLLAAGADMCRVKLVEIAHKINGENIGGTLTLPEDLDHLQERVAEIDARLLILDPLVSHLSSRVDSHRDQDMRRVLAPLTRMADNCRVAVLGSIHLNKSETTDVLTRMSGSIANAAGPRSVLALARDPDDPEGEMGSARVLAHAKCNVGKLQPSLLATIEQTVVADAVTTSRMVLRGETDQSARDLLERPPSYEERSAAAGAAAFLTTELAEGPVPTNHLKMAAAEAGIAWRTVERAKRQAGAKTRKSVHGYWEWHLVEPGSTQPFKSANPAISKATAAEPPSFNKKVGGDGGLPSLELPKSANRATLAGTSANSAEPPRPPALDADRYPLCTCALPARSPRPDGWFCQTCKRPGMSP